jgi:hypothetical protein
MVVSEIDLTERGRVPHGTSAAPCIGNLIWEEANVLATRRHGERLVTGSLLGSAGSFEHVERISKASLQDLSVLIDLFCLYDRVVLIGPQEMRITALRLSSELTRLLYESAFVEIHDLCAEEIEAMSVAAQRHLAAFLGVGNVDRYDRLFRFALSPGETSHSMRFEPHGTPDIERWRSLLSSPSSREDLLCRLQDENSIARGFTFLVRTFLYLGYADVTKLTFTPDAVRCPVLDGILRDEDKFLRQALMDKLQSVWEQHPTSGYRGLRRTISPFAAIVFERAKNRCEIVPQMVALRKELEPFRERLHGLEETALWGSRDEAVDAERRWGQVLGEIETNFGSDPHLVSIKRAIAFAESAVGTIADSPTSWKDWLSGLTSLPLEVAARLYSQRPAIEIHRLRSQLPSPGRLAQSAERMFGPVEWGLDT